MNCGISDKSYEHVLYVWEAFKMDSVKDYYDLYMKINVLLLVCVFETFRKESIDSFKLDSTHYLSTSSYNWDAMLRFTDVNSKLIPDIEKYQSIESRAKGGIYVICKGYAEANNKFLKP